jgi:DNA processing protein
MDQEKLAFVALHATPGIGDYLLKQLIAYCGSADQVFKQSRTRLLKIPNVGEKTVEAILAKQYFHQAERELKKAEKETVTLLTFTDAAYPQRLKEINDAPALLYVKGTTNLNHAKVVAIVGTRQATDYGKAQVEQLLIGLKPYQPIILSGLAYGIDIAAHKQALKQGLPTVAVLGSGLDVIYPAAHKETARKLVAEGGALVSENPFGTQPDAHNFPARNRIIAGLCDALIVVEAALKGGALITADIANSYQKDVFAVPGNVDATFSEGCNHLIKTNKAHLLQSVKDVEYIMNWSTSSPASPKTEPEQLSLSLSDPTEIAIVDALRGRDTISIDDLTQKTGLAPGTLAAGLLSLEMQNKLVTLPGKHYRLKSR